MFLHSLFSRRIKTPPRKALLNGSTLPYDDLIVLEGVGAPLRPSLATQREKRKPAPSPLHRTSSPPLMAQAKIELPKSHPKEQLAQSVETTGTVPRSARGQTEWRVWRRCCCLASTYPADRCSNPARAVLSELCLASSAKSANWYFRDLCHPAGRQKYPLDAGRPYCRGTTPAAISA